MCPSVFLSAEKSQVHIDHIKCVLVRLCLYESYTFEDSAPQCCLFMLEQCYSAVWAVILIRKGTKTRIPILQRYVTLILVSALQQDESGRYLALFLSHHHSVTMDLAGWNEDFHLLLPLMSLLKPVIAMLPVGVQDCFSGSERLFLLLDSEWN